MLRASAFVGCQETNGRAARRGDRAAGAYTALRPSPQLPPRSEREQQSPAAAPPPRATASTIHIPIKLGCAPCSYQAGFWWVPGGPAAMLGLQQAWNVAPREDAPRLCDGLQTCNNLHMRSKWLRRRGDRVFESSLSLCSFSPSSSLVTEDSHFTSVACPEPEVQFRRLHQVERHHLLRSAAP